MKLYQGRGYNNDGAVSQNMVETVLHDVLDQVESVYHKKNDTIARAMADEYGNRISEIYLRKDTEKVTQVNKFNVVPDTPEDAPMYKEFNFKVNNTSYAFPPVNVLKLDTSSDDITKSIFTFDNSDATSFIYESQLSADDPFRTLIFDSTMHLKKTFDFNFTTPTPFAHGYLSYSDIIPLDRFRKKYSITTESKYNDPTITQQPDSYKLFLSNNKLYTGTGLPICENWNISTDIAKENYFIQYRDKTSEFTAIKLLEESGLNNIQILIYTTDENSGVYHTGQFKGIPNKQVVIPKGLIPTHTFSSILNIDMSYQLIGNCQIKIAASSNLEDWYTYKLNIREWEPLMIEQKAIINDNGEREDRWYPIVTEIEEKGIPIDMIHTIANWDRFTSNISFAYLLLDENMNANASVNEVGFTATMRGNWQYYPNIDYYYANDNLNVRVFHPGSYKINYKRF